MLIHEFESGKSIPANTVLFANAGIQRSVKMSAGKILRKIANTVLHPLHWEVVKSPHFKNWRFNMGDALSRAGEHGIEVGTIIDIGASDGKWSKMAMKRFPAARVLAFEPLRERKPSLDRIKAASNNFDYVLAVAGDTESEITLHVSEDLDGSGVCEEGDSQARVVPMTTIDEEVKRRNLPGPYLIKLDTHGFEVPILAGAARTLKASSLVIIEVYNFKLNDRCLRFHEMCGYMEEHGFRCYDLVDPLLRQKDKAFWQMDIFFAPMQAPMFAYSGYQ